MGDVLAWGDAAQRHLSLWLQLSVPRAQLAACLLAEHAQAPSLVYNTGFAPLSPLQPTPLAAGGCSAQARQNWGRWDKNTWVFFPICAAR